MKKGLIGIMVLACVALIFGTALADVTFWSIDVSGSVEWIILDQTGLMPADTGGADEALVVPELKLTAGPWEAVAGAPLGDGYIKYTADMGSITLDSALEYDIFGLSAGIGNDKGIALATEMAPLSLSAVYQADQQYGLGATYDAGVATIGLAYNSVAWGAQMVATIAPITITLKTALMNNLNAYGLTVAAGSITLDYAVDFVSAYTLTGTLAGLALTESTLLGVVVTNTAAGTEIAATATTALADAVTLTTVLTSPAVGDITYSAKIGVTF